MSNNEMKSEGRSPVSLFIPCLVDQVYPEMGMAMVRVLKRLGHEVRYDARQTCCGQPAFNAGHWEEARRVARNFVEVFEDAETIVCPSGSCTAMVRNFYPELFEHDSLTRRANELGGRVFEFSEFLQKGLPPDERLGRYEGRIAFHNSCHSYRELGVNGEPLDLLRRVQGAEVVLPEGEPVCCGFGGLFSFKFETIAATMAVSRLETFLKLEAGAVVSNDPGCLMHMRQEAKQRGMALEFMHLAEFLDRAMGE